MTLACPACGAILPAQHKFCGECGAAFHTIGMQGTQAARVPAHLVEKVLGSKTSLEGERKQITVLFADLKSSMELLADRDPEEGRRILDPILVLMMEAVHRYEGTVNQVMGDGIMALFGAPLAHEDHAIRACYAALRMQQAIADHSAALHREDEIGIRIGLNSGEVVVRSVGSDLRMDYTAVGQTTHLAARMEQLAQPGTTLLTRDTERLVEGYVQVKSLGSQFVKGMSAPVEVYELLGTGLVRTRLQAATARGLTPLIGRESEIAQLQAAVEQAKIGRGQVVAVVGEPGLGKSRLIREFTHSSRAPDWLLLEADALSYSKAAAYLPVIDLLKEYFRVDPQDDGPRVKEKVIRQVRSLDGALEPTLPALLSLLDTPVDDPKWQDLDPLQRRERILDAVKHLLIRESRQRPVVLVFEDLQWVDSETAALLDNLVVSLATARLLLLVTYRPEHDHSWGRHSYYRQVRIAPLAPAQAQELVRRLAGDSPTLRPLSEILIDRSEGNPFFLEESIRSLIEMRTLVGEPGDLRLDQLPTSIQIPPTVQAVLASRIDRLPPAEKRLLQSASVIGKDVPVTVLQAIAEDSEENVRGDLARLQAAEFIYETSLFPETEYTFKHALTHEVAYQSLLHDRRKALHAKVVEAIERLYPDRLVEHAETLARHALRGEVWEKAVDHLREAAAKTYARAAFPEAVDLYEQALAIVPRLPATPANIRRAIDLRLDVHVPLFTLGQFSRLVELHREAEELARKIEDEPRLGRVIMRMAVYSWVNAEYGRGIAYARQSLSIGASLGDAELQVLASHVLAGNHFWRGEYREAIALFTRVVEGEHAELARRRLGLAFGSPYLLGCCFLTWCWALLGDFEQALGYGRLAAQTADSSGQPQAQAAVYTYMAAALALKGDFAKGSRWSEHAVSLCETKGMLVWLPAAYLGRGWALAWSGRADEAVEYLERAVSMSEGMGVKTSLAHFYVRWGEALILAGKVREARGVADRALALAVVAEERGNEAEALHLLGMVAMASDPPDVDAARGFYERSRTVAEALEARPIVARCQLGLGRIDRSEDALRGAATLFRDMHMSFWSEQAEAALRALSRSSP